MTGAREREADGDSCGAEGCAERYVTETRGAAAGMKSTHPVVHTAQAGPGAAAPPQQPSSDKGAC